MSRPRIVVATRSAHKLRELRELLSPERATLVSLDDLHVTDEALEHGASYAANARLKARFYAGLTGLPTLADDSGLEVDALAGGPGVRTRRFAGENASDVQNNAKLLRELELLPPDRRGARYVCVLALALPSAAGSRGTVCGTLAAMHRASSLPRPIRESGVRHWSSRGPADRRSLLRGGVLGWAYRTAAAPPDGERGLAVGLDRDAQRAEVP